MLWSLSEDISEIIGDTIDIITKINLNALRNVFNLLELEKPYEIENNIIDVKSEIIPFSKINVKINENTFNAAKEMKNLRLL